MKIRSRRPRHHAAFTMIELLTVMVIISILASVVFAVGPRIMRDARRTSVRTDMQTLQLAISSYKNEYGRFPVPGDLQGTDVLLGDGEGATAGTADLMNVLMAEPEGWNANHALNPKRIVFFSPKPAKGDDENPRNGLGRDGRLYDMWGQEFSILMDTGYDEALDVLNGDFDYEDRSLKAQDGTLKGTSGVLIHSRGSDGKHGKNGEGSYKGCDDVASWL